MDLKKKYVRWAYKHFGHIAEKYLSTLERDIHDDLKRAGQELTAQEYIAVALATSISSFIILTPMTSVILSMVLILGGTGAVAAAITSVIVGLLAGIFISAGLFMFFYVYPTIVIGEHQKKMKSTLPFALLYMETLAGSGMPLVGIFRTMSRFDDFGEVSRESQKIVSEVDLAGLDLPRALDNAAQRTASQELKEIFWGMKSMIVVGGDLKQYLHERAASSMDEYKRYLQGFTKKLAVMVEGYITLVIVGSIFFVVLTTIIGGLGGGSVGGVVTMQLLIVFVFLPLASVGFYTLVKGLSP